MELAIPKRWNSVSAVRDYILQETGHKVRERRLRWTHRLDEGEYYVQLSDEQAGKSDEIKEHMRDLYRTERPPKHIQVTFFKEGRPNAREASYSAKLSISEWDYGIPENTEIVEDSPEWNRLLTVINDDDPYAQQLFDLVSGSIQFVKVKLLKDVKRPSGKLIDQPVRDGSTAIPSHAFLPVEWTDNGFQPKGQPYSTRGDCLPRAIVFGLKESWDKEFNRIKTKSKMFPEPLSIKFITDFCKCGNEMSVPQLQPFLEAYRISLHVLDMKGSLLFSYVAPSRHKSLACCFYLLLHNHHVILLNHKKQSLERKDTLELLQRPSKHFQTGKMDGSPIVIHEFCDLKKHILNASEYTRVYYAGNMDDAFTRIASEMNLEATLKLDNYNEINELMFYHPPISILHLKLSINILKPLRDAIFLPHLKSEYSPTLMRAFLDMPRGHLKRCFADKESGQFIDIVRSYTANLHQLEHIPVFSKLDDLVPYDHSPIEPYTLYVVRKQFTLESWFILNNSYNLVSGFVLKASGISCIPLAMCRPSSVMPNTIREVSKKLYDEHDFKQDPKGSELKEAHNISFGSAGKRYNKSHYARFTLDSREAYHFSNDVIEHLHGFLAKKESVAVELVDGYYPFYFMIYDLQRLRILEMFKWLSKHTEVYGVATDGFFVKSVPKTSYHPSDKPKSFESLGKYQLEGLKSVPKVSYLVVTNETKMPAVVTRPPYTKIAKVCAGTFIDAEIAGAGKTYQALSYLTSNSLIVCQSDQQMAAMEYRAELPTNATVISYATLLGEIYDDGKLVKTTAPYDISKHDKICLDELFQIDVKKYEIVLLLIQGKDVVGTGDTFQTTTGVSYNNYVDRRQFYEETLWKAFPYRITLTKSWRLESPADEELILKMRRELQEGAPISSVIKYFKTTKDLTAFDTHIALTNLCSQKLEQMFGNQPTHLRFKDYDKNKTLVKKLNLSVLKDADGIHYAVKDGRRLQFLRHGLVYPVKHFHHLGVNKVWIGSESYNRCHFTGIHANTGHSLQGDTIRGKFCILEWNHFNATWEWFYTAVTRCVRLSDVYIYTGESLTRGVIKNVGYKLDGLKKTCEEKGRDFDLTAKWVTEQMKRQNYCCQICSGVLSLDYEQGDGNQWSIDRRDNQLGELQSNCRITHLSCNQSKAHEGKGLI